MYWPYEQLASEDADYANNEINDLTKNRDTGITILGRGVNFPTDENPKSPSERQGTAKRRIGLLISELWGGRCTMNNRNENKVSTLMKEDNFKQSHLYHV